MKLTALLSVAFLATAVAAQEAYDMDTLATRELDEETILPIAARAVYNRRSVYAPRHVKQRSQDRVDLFTRTIIDELESGLYPRWGSGKYLIDDDTYHRDVKPKILAEMNKIKGFSSKCGKNPDFHVERDGTVYPSSRVDKKGLCSKKAFSIHMHDLLISFIKPSRSPSPAGKRT